MLKLIINIFSKFKRIFNNNYTLESRINILYIYLNTKILKKINKYILNYYFKVFIYN